MVEGYESLRASARRIAGIVLLRVRCLLGPPTGLCPCTAARICAVLMSASGSKFALVLDLTNAVPIFRHRDKALTFDVSGSGPW